MSDLRFGNGTRTCAPAVATAKWAMCQDKNSKMFWNREFWHPPVEGVLKPKFIPIPQATIQNFKTSRQTAKIFFLTSDSSRPGVWPVFLALAGGR